MIIRHGEGVGVDHKYGPGVEIVLEPGEVATAIDAYLVANGVSVRGPRTTTINGALCGYGRVYVDPSGAVWTQTACHHGDGRFTSG